jgi:uncharacterized membrane protein
MEICEMNMTATAQKAQHEVEHLISMLPAPKTNVGKNERTLSLAAGALLAGLGLKRGSLPGLLLAAAGGLIAYRGLTGYCGLYDKLDINTNRDRGSCC